MTSKIHMKFVAGLPSALKGGMMLRDFCVEDEMKRGVEAALNNFVQHPSPSALTGVSSDLPVDKKSPPPIIIVRHQRGRRK
jgi:hypothetical protein